MRWCILNFDIEIGIKILLAIYFASITDHSGNLKCNCNKWILNEVYLHHNTASEYFPCAKSLVNANQHAASPIVISVYQTFRLSLIRFPSSMKMEYSATFHYDKLLLSWVLDMRVLTRVLIGCIDSIFEMVLVSWITT